MRITGSCCACAIVASLLISCSEPPPLPEPPQPRSLPESTPPTKDTVETPVFSEEGLAARTEQLLPLVAFELEQNQPLLEIGHELDCRLFNGLVARGTVEAIETNAIVLRKSTGDSQMLTFDRLDPATRLSADPVYRDIWVWSQATVEARKEIQAEGIEIPIFRCANDKEFQRALDCGDPDAHGIAGIQQLNNIKSKKDPAYAYLHLRIAAIQNNAKAQYYLGTMIYNGHGVAPNPDRGLRWISLAAAQNYAPATQFLTQHQIHQQAIAEAAQRAYQEKVEYTKRLEEARANPKYQTIATSIGLKGLQREKHPWPWPWDPDVHIRSEIPYKVVR